jgi:hypothetical protein
LGGVELVEAGVDLGVDAGDEERRHGGDPGQVVAVVLGLFEAGEVGVHHGAVPVEGEDQGDVHADALGEGGGDRGQAFDGGGDLDHRVGSVHQPPQQSGLRDRGLGVAGQPWVDLDRDAAVDAVGAVVDRP